MNRIFPQNTFLIMYLCESVDKDVSQIKVLSSSV